MTDEQIIHRIGSFRLAHADDHGGTCPRCEGAGLRQYTSTSTWRGGIGGQSFTNDVCDLCWGSGTVRPWPSHRR